MQEGESPWRKNDFLPLPGSNWSCRAGKSFWRAQESLQSSELMAEMESKGPQRGPRNRPMSQTSEVREGKKSSLKGLERDAIALSY